MAPNNSAPQATQPPNIMVTVGGLIICILVVYFSFVAINSLGLQEHTAIATVIDKGYRAAGKTYTTQKIGDRMMTIPQTTSEAYYLFLDIDGKKASYVVSSRDYNLTESGDQLEVKYVRKRITGGIQVTAITN